MLNRKTFVLFTAVFLALAAAGSAYAISDRGAAQREAHAVLQLQEEAEETQGAADDNDLGSGALAKIDLLATEFDVTTESVIALHDQGVGFGAMFKLYSIARATGVDAESLVGSAAVDAEGERGFAFGVMRNALTEDELATLEDGPKNFGHLVSASHKKPK